MKVIITGASGYAGFYAALALRDAGHHVTALLRHPHTDRARALRAREIHVAAGDLQQPATYQHLLDSCDALVHTVADHADPQGTDQVLFDALRKVARPDSKPPRFVYTTGCSIYGKVPERLMDETTPGNPAHALYYRMELEQVALALPTVRPVVVRPGFMYGYDGHSSMAARWFAMGTAGEVVYRGDPEKGWSWVHVADLAQAYVQLLAAGPEVDGEIFCLADAEQLACLAVQLACARAAGFRGEVALAGPDPRDWTSSVFDQNEFISSAKARRVLGWEPRHAGVLPELDMFFQAWQAAQPAT
jgi:nucleoside-diphosphate-sugar epimerase